MYCRQCGQALSNQSVFCNQCGTPVRPVPAAARQMYPPGHYATGTGKKMATGKKRVIVISVAVVVVAVLGLAVWQLGHLTGQWQRMALNRSLSAWERYDDRSEVEDAVLSRLGEMADLLEQGQTEAALAYIHPDKQQRYARDFEQYPDQIPILVEGLRSARLVLISDDLDAYAADRMVRVELQLPDEAYSSSRDDNLATTFTVTMVLEEERWVIDS